jgi:hypothetical protein
MTAQPGIYGAVMEHTASGVTPAPGVPLRMIFSGTSAGIVDLVSAADGTFAVNRSVAPGFVRIQVRLDYPKRTPCSPSDWQDRRMDVSIVARELLATSGVPSTVPLTTFGVLSGRVTERAAAGVIPVAGAFVGQYDDSRYLKVDENDPLGDTVTNANGEWRMCSVGHPEIVGEVRVKKAGYLTAIKPTEAWVVDVELTPQ